MKKILVFMVILANLVFGVQGFSQMNSKEFEKVMAKVAKEYDKGNKQKASGSQGRIHKILPQTSKEHFYHYNAKYRAKGRNPPDNPAGDVKSYE